VPQTKQDLIPQARELYARGISLAEIADSLHVNASTISRWKAAAEKAGRPWSAARERAQGHDPRAVLSILDQSLAGMATDLREAVKGDKGSVVALADALQKVDNVRARLEARYGGITTELAVLEKFALFVRDHLDDVDLGVVRRAVDAYLDDAKRRITP